MVYSRVLEAIHSLSESELQLINSAVIARIKSIRSAEADRKRFLFAAGDRVTWTGRRGTYEGIIERVKQKKALVKVGVSTWDVPISMLEATI